MFANSNTETLNWHWIKNVENQSLCSLIERCRGTSKQTNSFIVPGWKQQFLRFPYRNGWLPGNQFILTRILKLNHRDNHYLYKNLRCKNMWNTWDLIRCVALSPLIVGTIIAVLNLLERCIVRTQSVRIYYACTESFSNLLKDATINVFIACPCVKCAILPSKYSQIRLFVKFSQGFFSFRRVGKINSRCFWRCALCNMPKRKVCLPVNQRKSNFTFLRSAKLALTCLIFHLRHKNQP